MKVKLTVAQGVHQGKVIPVTLSQFLIGRDPQCQLRPASVAISKRHCAVLSRGDKVFVRDFDSTNGTFINDQPVKGEMELRDGDTLKVGPLLFTVGVEVGVGAPLDKPVPAPQPAGAASGSDDEEGVAAMLLGLQEGDGTPTTAAGADSIPSGSTVLEVPAVIAGQKEGEAGKPDGSKGKKANTGNTRTAAEEILKKYMRRPRS